MMADTMKHPLQKEFDYFLKHKASLVKKYRAKFVVLKNCEVIGAYDSEMEAISETTKEHKLGSFLVQQCTPGEEGYTQTFHSRVCFS